MAKIEINMQVRADEMVKACERATKALKEFRAAVGQLENAEISIEEVKPTVKKWWQFWKRT